MKKNQFDQFIKTVDSNSIILVNGPEDYFKIALYDYMRENLKGIETFSYVADDLNKEKALALISDSEMMPFLSERKFYYIRDVDKLHKSVIDLFAGYFDNIAPTSVFLLTSTKIDGRGAFYKKINKKGTILKAAQLYDNQCYEWITYFSSKYGKKIDRDASSLLVDLVGSSLISLDNEIKKISSFLNDRKTITSEDVIQMTTSIKMSTIFELTDAIGAQDKVKSLFLLQNMKDQGIADVFILSMISRHFKILLKVIEMQKKRTPSREIGSKLKIVPFLLDKYLSQANKIPEDRALSFYKKLFDTDLKIKSFNWDKTHIAEELILSV